MCHGSVGSIAIRIRAVWRSGTERHTGRGAGRAREAESGWRSSGCPDVGTDSETQVFFLRRGSTWATRRASPAFLHGFCRRSGRNLLGASPLPEEPTFLSITLGHSYKFQGTPCRPGLLESAPKEALRKTCYLLSEPYLLASRAPPPTTGVILSIPAHPGISSPERHNARPTSLSMQMSDKSLQPNLQTLDCFFSGETLLLLTQPFQPVDGTKAQRHSGPGPLLLPQLVPRNKTL